VAHRAGWPGRGRAAVALVAVLAAIGAGCGGKTDPRLVRNTNERFSVRGASVLPPRGSQWYRGRRDLAYVEFLKDVGRQGLHTVKASLWAQTVETPIATGDALSRFVETSTRSDFADHRYTITMLTVTPEPGSPIMCDRLRFTVEDRSTPGPVSVVLVVSGWDVLCVHPDGAGRLLVGVGESQRYVSPSQAIDVAAETTPMLQSLRFERLDL
jgi:hypothetical protein